VQSRVIHRDVVKPVDTGELDGEGVARGEGWVCYGQLARTIYTSKRNICPGMSRRSLIGGVLNIFDCVGES